MYDVPGHSQSSNVFSLKLYYYFAFCNGLISKIFKKGGIESNSGKSGSPDGKMDPQKIAVRKGENSSHPASCGKLNVIRQPEDYGTVYG